MSNKVEVMESLRQITMQTFHLSEDDPKIIRFSEILSEHLDKTISFMQEVTKNSTFLAGTAIYPISVISECGMPCPLILRILMESKIIPDFSGYKEATDLIVEF